ncbi:MAG TPA: hypothetical protein VLJ59_06935 [Mycobacteriales bacterium]|nr:hypothetical protein [Mycobacteriales bacterium]
MAEATQSEPDRLRVRLSEGESIELDGGTVRLDEQEPEPALVLRLVPWRALALARVLEEWSAVSRAFSRDGRPGPHEVELSRALVAAAAAMSDAEPVPRMPRGGRSVPSRRRLAALAALGDREGRLSALQRLALVDAASWWLSEEHGGEELAYALLDAACSSSATTEHVYLTLIAASPAEPPPPTDHSEDLSS